MPTDSIEISNFQPCNQYMYGGTSQCLEWRIVFSFTLSVFYFPFSLFVFVNVWRSTTALYDDYLEE